MSPKERQVEVSKTTFHVVDSARRGLLPIVAVHGFPGADQMSLRGTAGFDELDARTRVVFYDQRGAGRSGGRETGAPSLGQHAADLDALIGALNIERPIIIAHAAGASIAVRLGLDHPAAVSGLVLVCPLIASGGMGDGPQVMFERRIADCLGRAEVSGLGSVGAHDPDIALRSAMEEVFPLGFLRFGLHERSFMEGITFRRQAYDDVWAALAGDDLRSGCRTLRIPVLVIAGRFDPLVDLSATRRLCEGAPGARFVLFHESAHWPFVEQPQAFADEIWAWMEEVAAHIV